MTKLTIVYFIALVAILQSCSFHSTSLKPLIPPPILDRIKPADMPIVEINEPEILQRSKVHYLKLDGNYSIKQLEGILSHHPEIEYVHIRLYKRKNLDSIFQQLIKLQRLKYMELTLAESIPASIALFSSLKCLIINDSYIKYLPPEIGKLDSLETLCLGFLRKYGQLRNELKDLPVEITNLRQLRYLYLSANQFKEVPELICQLPKLEYLVLTSNDISTLPPCLCQQNVAINVNYTNIDRKKLKPKCLKKKLTKEFKPAVPKVKP